MDRRTKFLLLLILVIGFLTRTYFWYYGFGFDLGKPGLVRDGDGYLQMAATFGPSSDLDFFHHWRAFYQLLYPLILAPIFIFGLNDSIYVFWLHHFFVASTIICIYLSASELGKTWAGLLAALVYACQMQVAFWFSWTDSDTAFHFVLSLLLYGSLLCWKQATGKRVFLTAISGVLVTFTRPEGIVITTVSFLVLAYRLLVPRIGPFRAIFITIGPILVLVLSGSYVLTQNKNVREAVFSNIHVGWGLNFGSRETMLKPGLVNASIWAMKSECRAKAMADPEKRNYWYWCSVTGLENIANDPLNYIRVLAKRLPNLMYPSLFRDSYSLKYKIVDRGVMFFITIGVMCALIFRHVRKFEVVGLTLMASSLIMFINMYQAEWDVRVQLSAQVLLIPIAALGWIMLLDRIRERFQPS